jgi:glucans biosynthesis protein C
MHTENRLHAFDAVRAIALLSGLFLHATMSFFIPLPVRDNQQSTTLSVAFYILHMFRMSTFYFIAGFFGRMMLHRIGFRTFARDRARRILAPLAVGWLVLMPPLAIAVIWGAIRTYGLEAIKSSSPPLRGFPLTHLWFLYYLSMFYALVLAMRWCLNVILDRRGLIRDGLDKALRVIVNTNLAPILLAAPICTVLYLSPEWPIWFGIPTPDYGFTPKIPALAGFGVAFIFGWLLQRQMPLLERWEQRWHAHFALALILTILCLYIAGPSPNLTQPSVIAGPPWLRLAYTACYTLGIWCWVIAIVGGSMRFLKHASPVRRYIADSSYWLYLVHLPIIFLLQVAVMKWALHWSIKFTLILAITLAIALATYHWFVRYTFIGAWLNGKRYARNL